MLSDKTSSASVKSFGGLKSLIFPLYLPMALNFIGTGLTVTFIPLFAGDLGADNALCVLIAGLNRLGLLIFDLPAGYLVRRWGLRRSMVFSSLVMAIVVLLPGLFPNLFILGLANLFFGFCNAIFFLGLTAYSGKAIPVNVRGRGLSSMGGILRIGNFLGPLIGGFLAHYAGYQPLFVLRSVLVFLAGLLLWLFLKPIELEEEPEKNFFRVMWKTALRHKKIYLTSGLVMLVLMLLRAARPTLISLWGRSLSLDLLSIGLVASLGQLIDLVMFIPSGWIMDKKGRKVAVFLCLGILSFGLIFLPFTTGFITFMLCSIVIGLGNGLGAGINMTIGADATPEKEGASFLGIWRTITDLGGAMGAWLIAPISLLMNLGVSSLVLGVLGLLGVVYLKIFVKETNHHDKN